MNFQFEFLWTDILVYLLLVCVFGYAVYTSRHEHLKAPWLEVKNDRIAMAAAFVLACYLIIGLCDSVHFRLAATDKNGVPVKSEDGMPVYNPEVLSLFDMAVLSLKQNNESTYSSPLAVYSHSKENITMPDGGQVRNFPRLKHGGSHLQSTGSRYKDIIYKILAGGFGFTLWGILISGSIIFIKRRIRPSGKNKDKLIDKQSAPLFIFCFGILFCIGAAFHVSRYYHLLGTDKVGLDVFYRALKGIRTGMVIGTLTSLIMLPFAIMMGTMAGYFKGIVDDIIQYIYITISSVPGILLIASAVKILQVYMDLHGDRFGDITVRADTQLFFLCVILGMTSWTGLCRIIRGETLKLRELEYVQASRALGLGHFTIIAKHIIPNIMHIVLITVVLNFSGLVLAEAVLSYVGVGVDPTMESWGNMINAARLELARDPVVWWNLMAAFVLMFGLVLSANLFADGVRDAFDPRLRARTKIS